MSTFVVRGGVVFDGTEWRGVQDIVLRDGIVVEEEPSTRQAHEQIDAAGCWVIPALTDGHCHLLPSHLLRLPFFGVGFAVDMFSTGDMRPGMDQEAAAGGARYVTSDVGASVRGGHPYQLVESGLYRDFPSLEESGGPAAFVRDRVAAGASLIKVFVDDGRAAGQCLPTLQPSDVALLVAEAHARRLPVVAHAPTVDLALAALEAGVDGLAHVPIPYEDAESDDVVAALAARRAFVISTVVAIAAALGVPLVGSLPRSRLWERISTRWRRHLGLAGRAVPEEATLRRVLKLLASAHEAGIPVYPGTDAAFPGVMPGASLHVELEVLRDCGFSDHELLVAATSGLRRRMGWRLGGAHPEGRAELLVLEEDPRESITATRSMRTVILGEKVLRF